MVTENCKMSEDQDPEQIPTLLSTAAFLCVLSITSTRGTRLMSLRVDPFKGALLRLYGGFPYTVRKITWSHNPK